jgi:hypothetical protein
MTDMTLPQGAIPVSAVCAGKNNDDRQFAKG